jgi:hypothetical protein
MEVLVHLFIKKLNEIFIEFYSISSKKPRKIN